ncbi:MAG: hypothetical protein FJ386_05100 [Verrucomicrobia bacterium]|nr:hypothetical protein [Verrucomicrobiota bacterium]
MSPLRPRPCRRRPLALAATVFLSLAFASRGQSLLDKVDDALFLQSRNGSVRSDLSGLLDLEGYYIDQRPPGMIFGNGDEFFNPRLSLFLDTRLGPHLYSLVQARVDRGFDPRSRVRSARFDEYLLRWTPFEDSRLHLQAGKFATVFGAWVPRHDSWNNPFINAPLPYEHMTTVNDAATVASGQGLVNRRAIADNKPAWLPVLWGPAYTTGGSMFGQLGGFDYAFELKNAAPSSRPMQWDAHDRGFDHTTVAGRLGWRPNAAWNLGASVSEGAYLDQRTVTPAGTSAGDFRQTVIGQDISYARHGWQVWAEVIASRFEVPNVGNADSLAYFVEAKRKLGANHFAAVRWNQMVFDKVPTPAGPQPWDNDVWRVDTAFGWRLSRHVQGKLQYSFSHQKGTSQQGEQLLAAQVTLRF